MNKKEVFVFSQKNQHHIKQIHFNGNITRPKVSCRYLGLIFDNKLNFDKLKIEFFLMVKKILNYIL